MTSRVAGTDRLVRAMVQGRRWILIGLCAGLALGATVVLATPASWTATTTLQVGDLPASIDLDVSGGVPLGPPTVDTDAQIVRSDGVVSAVARETGRSPAQVRDAIQVSGRRLTRVLEIGYTSTSASDALRGAQAAGSAFLRERQRLLVSPQLTYLSQILADTEDPELSTGLLQDVSPDAPEPVGLLEARRQRASDLQLELTASGTVLEQTRITAAADRGSLEVPLASGAAAGALAGVLLHALHGRVRTRRRSA